MAKRAPVPIPKSSGSGTSSGDLAALLGDLIDAAIRLDAASSFDSRGSAMARQLFLVAAQGPDARECIEPHRSSTSTSASDSTYEALVLFGRAEHAALTRVFALALSLAGRLGVRRLGRIRLDGAHGSANSSIVPGQVSFASRLLEDVLADIGPRSVDIPSDLLDRGVRLRKIEELVHLLATQEKVGLRPPSRPGWILPASDKLLALVFALFLVVPLLVFLIAPETSALRENRNPAPSPRFGIDPITKWPGEIEAYYDDRFGLRSPLVRAYNIILRKQLRESNSDVIFGKEDWLFYAREHVFDDFFGNGQFTAAELKQWRDYLENRGAMLARANVHYLFVIAPDKNAIYPEMLPDYIQKRRGRSRLEQLREYLRDTGAQADVLDLHDALLAAKPEGDLYFRQDTHWNGRGYFVAYQAMFTALRRWFPEITPQRLGRDYAIQSAVWAGGEWGLVGLPEEGKKHPSDFLIPLGTQKARRLPAPVPSEIPFIPEPWKAPLYWEGPGQHNLLLFHDSFMRNGPREYDMAPPLAENFARTFLIGIYPSDGDVRAFLASFHPDVIIEERTERAMAAVPPPASGELELEPADSAHLSTCSAVEQIVGPNTSTPIGSKNALIEKRPTGIAVVATSDSPFIVLPALQRAVDGIKLKITVPESATLRLYSVTDNFQEWGPHPLRVTLEPGVNTLLLPVARKNVKVLRLDVGDKKMVYLIENISYLSGCK